MWIRSQDKTRLLKANCIEYILKEENITKEILDKKGKPVYYLGRPAEEIVDVNYYHCILINGLNCGIYSSEEKALKVIDEIQFKITDSYGDFSYDGSGQDHFCGSIYTTYNSVYQMPEDE